MTSTSTNRAEPYVLRANGQPHRADIRGVSFCTDDNTILTASRDHTACMSAIPPLGDDRLESQKVFAGHEAFVNVALAHPGISVLDGEPSIVTVSNDNHVALWNKETATLEAVLDGHAQGVCCATIIGDHPAVSPDGNCDASTPQSWSGDLLTGDWAGTCIIFDQLTGRPKQVYSKHSVAIRGVAHLPNTLTVVSGSGDKTVHVWNIVTGATCQIFSGHADVVQCVCALGTDLFASGSNDSTIRIWRLGLSRPVKVLTGHDSLIYTIAYNAVTRELVSASEDRSVRIWGLPPSADASGDVAEAVKSWGLVQVLPHPCVVWCVAVHPVTGDLSSGGSDGTLRLWTRDDRYMASPDCLEMHEQELAAQTVDVKVAASQQNATAGLDVASMPTVDALSRHSGTSEGERIFARTENGAVEVYTWSCARWNKLGTVVAGPKQQPYTGAPLAREKTVYNGAAYDYVFDVDVDGRPLKLAYNVGDSIFETAQQFINDHHGIVTQDSREDIQNFLLAHIEPQDLQKVAGLSGYGAQQGSSSSQPPVASSGPHAAPAEALFDPWQQTERREGFSADGAQRKINELLTSAPLEVQQRYVDVAARLQQAVSQSTSSPQDVVVQLVTNLNALFAQLPVGQRFPAVDGLRYLLTAPTTHLRTPEVWAALQTALTAMFTASGFSDSELLTTLRLLSNAVAAVVSVGTPAIAEGWLRECLERVVVTASAPQRRSSPALRTAVTLAIRNTAVLLSSTAEGSCDDGDAIAVAAVNAASQILVVEPCGSAVIPDVLRTLRTLWQPTSVGCAAAKACGRRAVLMSLRSIQTGADPSCVGAATTLVQMLEEQ